MGVPMTTNHHQVGNVLLQVCLSAKYLDKLQADNDEIFRIRW